MLRATPHCSGTAYNPAVTIFPDNGLGLSWAFGQAVSSCYSQYATFSGRASRSEFWFFSLFQMLVTFAGICLMPIGIGVVIIFGAVLVNFLPHLSVTVRRLHDTDHSGWWYWICLIPLAGIVLLLIWGCTRGTWGDNRFGPDPLEGQAPRPPYYAPAPRADLADEISRLAKLRDQGAISEEEFQRLKTKLI
jgi:uncharacterized membrane protein YhaH (DUF805 family)